MRPHEADTSAALMAGARAGEAAATRTWPDFLIIGAAKSGTTALYEYLNQHPGIFMSPVKEPNFFALADPALSIEGPRADLIQRIGDLDAYCALFSGRGLEQVAGEASTYYLYVPGTAERIHERIPGMKIVAVLRNPVDRAFSQFLMNRMLDREPIGNFEQALEAEDGRVSAGWAPDWHYRRLGLYHEQLSRYYGIFERDRIRVYLYDDLRADAAAVVRDILRFLGVDDTFQPDVSRRHNVSRVPWSGALARLLRSQNGLKSLLRAVLPAAAWGRLRELAWNIALTTRPRLSERTLVRLANSFREDLERLEGLLGRSLRGWIDDPSNAIRGESEP